MMLSRANKELSTLCLLLLCLRAAANSKVCSDGVCPEGDVFGEPNDLSLMQMTALEKRAQEAGSRAQMQKLDAAIKKKGDSGSSDSSTDDASTDAASKTTTSKDKSSKDKSSKDTTSKDKSSTKKSKPSKPINASDEFWSLMGDGCCEGKREPSNGKLFGLNVSTIEDCKKKCREFNNCGIIEYGWTEMPEWCYGWGTSQKCEKRDKDCVESVPGNGKGVQGYSFKAPKVDFEAAAKTEWEIIGPGCCDGAREESNGKLYANKEPTLDACKARCLTWGEECGIVEYGWTTGDPEWCYIWDSSQKCKKMDLACQESAMGNGFGAKAHRLLKK
mmetsp:Transcript_14852/g.27502  ORF Transcript_14852/g.27502 Transcript_14852/m.27502 type:complete len:331 (+) Transcript_14852:76-1068(+)